MCRFQKLGIEGMTEAKCGNNTEMYISAEHRFY